jgi:hypothetical protein
VLWQKLTLRTGLSLSYQAPPVRSQVKPVKLTVIGKFVWLEMVGYSGTYESRRSRS